MPVTPFRIDVPQATLDRIRTRLADATWPDVPRAADPAHADAWAYGTSEAALRDLVGHWLTRYDWRAREAAMNRFPQFKAAIDGYDIHFLQVTGSGRNPQPIILSHGWPGSFVEFLKAIEPLTQPEKHGGTADDAFTVVVPSLPGFGFSAKPPHPISTRTIGRLFDRLMTDELGHAGYIAQGGDYGCGISCWMGYEGRGCKAVHINYNVGWAAPDAAIETDEEKAAAAGWQKRMQTEGGYIAIQGTKPLTLSYGLADSPLGQAAWILEKFRTWSQTKGGDPFTAHTRDEILDNIMVYLVTGTLGTSTWMYTGGRGEPPHPPLPNGARITRPVGYARFPGDGFWWPRSYIEKSMNVVRWNIMPAGGHFAAMEQPMIFTEEVRAFRRQIAG